MFGLGKYLWGALATLISALGFAAWWFREAEKDAREAGRKAEHRARRAEAASQHVQETMETTREVEDDLRRSDADARRDELRRYATGSGYSDR